MHESAIFQFIISSAQIMPTTSTAIRCTRIFCFPFPSRYNFFATVDVLLKTLLQAYAVYDNNDAYDLLLARF